jgi:hypothetical protein
MGNLADAATTSMHMAVETTVGMQDIQGTVASWAAAVEVIYIAEVVAVEVVVVEVAVVEVVAVAAVVADIVVVVAVVVVDIVEVSVVVLDQKLQKS